MLLLVQFILSVYKSSTASVPDCNILDFSLQAKLPKSFLRTEATFPTFIVGGVTIVKNENIHIKDGQAEANAFQLGNVPEKSVAWRVKSSLLILFLFPHHIQFLHSNSLVAVN